MTGTNRRAPTTPAGAGRRLLGIAICVCGAALALQGCLERGETDGGGESEDAAVQIWAHPDTLGLAVYTPLDFDLASRNVVWAIDRFAGVVLRYDPSKGEHGVIGLQERPPAEIVRPARLAVAQEGIFVFDDSTEMIDLYAPGGQHLRGFDPGLRPSILEVSQNPLRLTYGVRTFTGSDTIPTLSIIQSDFLGRSLDTLLSPAVGPASLRNEPALRRNVVVTPAASGLWVFARSMSDTVFEVSSSDRSRKLALPETDSMRVGVIADLQQEILWVVSPRPMGGLDYEAFDVSGEGTDGIIDGRAAYLGARTTPGGFSARVAYDGVVSGWSVGERRIYAPEGFDMRIEELRGTAEQARADRDARRAAISEEWERLAAVADSIRESGREDEQTIREEEELQE